MSDWTVRMKQSLLSSCLLLLCNTDVCLAIDECSGNDEIVANCGAFGSCVETQAGFNCNCQAGYKETGAYPVTTCGNINECSGTDIVTADCGGGGTCIDQDGGFACQCTTGYESSLAYPSTTCTNINECDANASAVASCGQGTCIDLSPYFECDCNPGYEQSGAYPNINCINADECANGVANCGLGTCVDGPGGFACNCPTGYMESGSYPSTTCKDVDECDISATPAAACGAGTCENTIGGFTCNCNTGYELQGAYPYMSCVDINDCSTGVCGVNGVCHNNEGGYSCNCDPGFEQIGTYPDITCVDIDEADQAASVVADCRGGTVVNLTGGFVCNCNPGYEAVGAYPVTTCIDIDECDANASVVANCGDNGVCVNNNGGFSCECNSGFESAASYPLTQCININECDVDAIIVADCGNGSCVDSQGAFSCVCDTGYFLTGTYPSLTCSNIAECDGANAAGVVADCGQGTCVDSDGGFTCECNVGYELSVNYPTTTCVNINECSGAAGVVADCGQGTCVDSDGGFTCTCNAGYQSVGTYPVTTCVDINECTGGVDCGNGVCNNHDGGYSCACSAGYETDGATCNTIDECTDGSSVVANCGPGTCVETDGGFDCTCDAGFVSAGSYPSTTCININECDPAASVVADCSANGQCVDNNGSFSCICHVGYEFDGTTCIDINECDVNPTICGNGVFGGVFPSTSNGLLGSCSNTVGSYDCDCHPGTELVPGAADSTTNNGLYYTGRFCQTVDTCEVADICTDLHGDGADYEYYQYAEGCLCSCNEGYIFTNGYCYNIDQAFIPGQCGTLGDSGNFVNAFLCSEHGVSVNCGTVPGAFNVDTRVNLDCINNPDSESAGWACIDSGTWIGTYSCICNVGYRAGAAGDDGAACLNVDECADGVSATGTVDCGGGTCVDNDGSYTCECDVGYELNTDNADPTCVNIDECSVDPNICGTGLYKGSYPSTQVNALGICVDTQGSYICECSDGNTNTDATFTQCEDVDECIDYTCPSGVDNSPCVTGTLISPWWNPVSDVDGSHDFTGVSRCYCACSDNFDFANGYCTNIDQAYDQTECDAAAGDDVGEWELCDDAHEGLYYTDGLGALGDSCVTTARADCPAPPAPYTGPSCGTLHENVGLDGWTIEVEDGGSDGDIYSQGFGDSMSAIVMAPGCTMSVFEHEFENGRAYTCDNTGGTEVLTCDLSQSNNNMDNVADSYHCSCTARRRRRDDVSSSDWSCRELDVQGSTGRYKCKCNLGYYVTDGACGDIDECAIGTSATETVDCGVGTCVNNDGSYSCDCPDGYILDAAGITCIDKDECDVGDDTCDNYKCINTDGSFICDCADPEICPEGSNPAAATCVDEAVCDSCQCSVGYEYDENGVCVDIDECALDVDGALCVNGACVNDSGDYHCACNAGFEESEDVKACNDIDECFSLLDRCPIHSDCFNTPGGYLCVDLVCNRNDFPVDWHPCPDNAPLPCDYRVGQDIQVPIETDGTTNIDKCGKVHCIAQGNDFNCGCIEPVHPYGWSVHKLKLSVNEGWNIETAEGARAKCHSLGYEMLQLRYKYQFDAIVDYFGADKLDNTWAGKDYYFY